MSKVPNYASRPVVEVTDIHENTSQEIIQITADKLELILERHKGALQRANEWHTPFATLLTLLLVFITSDFRAIWGVTPDQWNILFKAGLAFSTVWLLTALWHRCRAPTLEDIMTQIKKPVAPRSEKMV